METAKKATNDTGFNRTGRRKSAVARVRLTPGTGRILVNRREVEEYFPREPLRTQLRRPLVLTQTEEAFDVSANVCGGGLRGQAEAIRHGIARALLEVDSEKHRSVLKKAGLLTRDPRKKERKKYGQPGARKRFQYSKR